MSMFPVHAVGNRKHFGELPGSLLISLGIHVCFAFAMASIGGNESNRADSLSSTAQLRARITINKTISIPSQSAVHPLATLAKNESLPPAQETLATDIEEILESSPYLPPENLEQIANTISPPDLPLPSDPNSPYGSMRLKVYVNENGSADHIEVLESNIAEDYAKILVELFKQATFTPGVSDGKATKSWRIIEVDYSPA